MTSSFQKYNQRNIYIYTYRYMVFQLLKLLQVQATFPVKVVQGKIEQQRTIIFIYIFLKQFRSITGKMRLCFVNSVISISRKVSWSKACILQASEIGCQFDFVLERVKEGRTSCNYQVSKLDEARIKFFSSQEQKVKNILKISFIWMATYCGFILKHWACSA